MILGVTLILPNAVVDVEDEPVEDSLDSERLDPEHNDRFLLERGGEQPGKKRGPRDWEGWRGRRRWK